MALSVLPLQMFLPHPAYSVYSGSLLRCGTLLFYAPHTCLSRHKRRKTNNFLDLIVLKGYNISALLYKGCIYLLSYRIASYPLARELRVLRR